MMRAILLALLAYPLAAQSGLYINLADGWRTTDQDDPAMARPDYDDSAWNKADLSKIRAPGSTLGANGWLRRTVDLPDWADRRHLALTLGHLPANYEVFVNGQRTATVGRLGTAMETQLPRTRTFAVPEEAISKERKQFIAIHFEGRVRSAAAWIGYDPGLFLLTDIDSAPVNEGSRRLENLRARHTPTLVISIIYLILCIPLVLAWLGERDRAELLWFCGYLIVASLYGLQSVLMIAPESLPYTSNGFAWLQILTRYGSYAMYASFVIVALGLNLRWFHAVIWLGWLYLQGPVYFTRAFGYFTLATGGVSVVLIAVAWRKLLKENAPAAEQVFLLVLSLPAIEQVASRLNGINGSGEYFIRYGTYVYSSAHVMTLLLASLIVVLLLRQMIADRRDRQRLKGEMEAGRTAQLFLLGSGMAISTGKFDIDPAYEPALEVGGDFHWTRVEPDGSLIAVAGDVSGKGLKAAMLVSVAIGILRNEKSSSPATILGALNEGLVGHTGGGFITCCCARFCVDGNTTIANAGHLSPYCDGREVTSEAGLPLGIIAGVEYAETVVQGARFTFVSDGVVEAANAKNELFGFERTREISGKSAQEIVDAAKAWGQNDDITVVTVRRNA